MIYLSSGTENDLHEKVISYLYNISDLRNEVLL